MKYKTSSRTQQYLGTRIPGKDQAYNSFFWKNGTGGTVRRMPRPLSSVGHNVGPPWSTFKDPRLVPAFRYGTHRSTALEIVKSCKRFPRSLMLTPHDSSRAVEIHELRQNASPYRETLHKYGKKIFGNSGLNSPRAKSVSKCWRFPTSSRACFVMKGQ